MPNLEPQQLYSQVEKSIEAQNFHPIYFFFGEEPYLIQQATQYLKVCALAGGAADFNFTSFYAADVNVSQVRDEVETLPMMAPRRVILLREVHDLTDKEWQELESLFTSPVDSSVFILSAGKIDKRKKFFKILLEKAQLVEFKKPFENQIPGWVRHICKGHALTISDDAIQLLHRLVGSQLTEIEAEVRKLADFISPKVDIALEDVAKCVSKKREENVFDLCESIANGSRVEALEQLVQLLDQGQNEVGIVSLISRHIRILQLIRQGLEQNLTGQKLATLAQVPSYYVQDYVRQSRKWTQRRLEQALLVLAETDKALKSSPISGHIWLENLILKICIPPASGLVNGNDRTESSQRFTF